MSRIKKAGLDYFPLDIDFVNNRFVRRIMKREGEGALATLISTLSCIYGGEGYYVKADEFFFDDLAAGLYSQSAEDVKRILMLAVEYGIFNAELFGRHGILTSGDIQSQYLFSTKRRKSSVIDPLYYIPSNRNEEEEAAEDAPAGNAATGGRKKDDAAFNTQNVTSGTHSTAQNSKAQDSVAQNSTENLLPNDPLNPNSGNADRMSAEEGKEEVFSSERAINFLDTQARKPQTTDRTPQTPARKPQTPAPAGNDAATPGAKAPRKAWTEEDIERLTPPEDGLNRNLPGMIQWLRLCRIPLQEQYAIILKSNYGIIGHPVWKGFFDIRESHGKIRFPGKFLLSLC